MKKISCCLVILFILLINNVINATTCSFDNLYVLFVLDTSDSMNQVDGGGTRIATLKTRAKALIDKIDNRNSAITRQYGIITFNSSVSTTNAGPLNATNAKNAINNISASGRTSLFDAVWTGANSLKLFLDDHSTYRGVLVVLSDGVDNQSSSYTMDNAITKVNSLKTTYSNTKVFFYFVEGSVPGGTGATDTNNAFTSFHCVRTSCLTAGGLSCPSASQAVSPNPPVELQEYQICPDTNSQKTAYVYSGVYHTGGYYPTYEYDYYVFDDTYSTGGSGTTDTNPMEEMASQTTSKYINNKTITALFSKISSTILALIPTPAASGKVFVENPVKSAGGCSSIHIDDQDLETTLNSYRKKIHLKNLIGSGALNGTYVEVHNCRDDDACEANEFIYNVNGNHFEEVMAYYHIDKFQQFLQSSKVNATTKTIVQDVHDDTSSFPSSVFYIPNQGSGEGIYLKKVNTNRDDAEDADIIVHEYSHAINSYLNRVWYITAAEINAPVQTKAAMEGFADFLTANYFKTSKFGQWYGKIYSDGCPLREIDNPSTYSSTLNMRPMSLVWSGALWKIRKEIGKTVGDKVSAKMTKYIGSTINILDSLEDVTLEDIANTMATNSAIPSEHRNIMRDVFENRGILTPIAERISLTYPTTPTILHVTDLFDDTKGYGLHIEWDEISETNLSGFELWRSTGDDTHWSLVDGNIAADEIAYDNYGTMTYDGLTNCLKSGQPFYYMVKAKYTTGNTYSNVLGSTVERYDLAQPLIESVQPITLEGMGHGLTITWDMFVIDTLVNYDIQGSPDGIDWYDLETERDAILPEQVNVFGNTVACGYNYNLPSEGIFYYRIRARYEDETVSNWSNWAVGVVDSYSCGGGGTPGC